MTSQIFRRAVIGAAWADSIGRRNALNGDGDGEQEIEYQGV